jgi:diguanylate cyclase (GGDEF)-like protein
MALDSPTLMTLATCITGLLGIFLVVLWVQERAVRALAWWGVAYLVGASAVTFWGAQGALPVPPELPNALLFIACGMVWTGARLFHGRKILPGALFAGAVVWFVAMQYASFAGSEQARVVLSSVVIAIYAFCTAFELRRERRRPLLKQWLSIAVPLMHATVFLAPVPFCLLIAGNGSGHALFALFALETILYVVGTAFIVVVMAKERTALVHKTAAMTDQLTGVFNRRAFLDAADRLIAKRARRSQPVSLLLFDLDHFKSINDRFGHAVGDEALKVFARTAVATLRTTDVVARLGGEEFVALIPGSAAEAAVAAERVRVAFLAAGLVIAGREMAATVSTGIASGLPPLEINALLARADRALYRAKANGRNRIEIAAPGPDQFKLDSLPALTRLGFEPPRLVEAAAPAR